MSVEAAPDAMRRVALEIVVFSVDVTQSRERSVDLALLRDAALAAQLTSAGSALVGATNGGGQLTLSFDDERRWDGSRMVLHWLNQQGNTEIVTRTRLEAGNHQMVSIEGLVSEDFVKSVTRDRSISGATETTAPTVEIKTTDTGTVMHLLPTIHEQSVDLLLSLSTAEIVTRNSYSFDEGRIEGVLPVVRSANQMLNLHLRHGESRLITHLSRDETSSTGVEVPWLPWIGDATASGQRRIESVMLVTAVIHEG